MYRSLPHEGGLIMQDEQGDELRTDDEGAKKPNPPKMGPDFSQRDGAHTEQREAVLPYLD
jgi:hypothetical protein